MTPLSPIAARRMPRAPVRASRATASRRSSTPPSRCSRRSATTASPWTPWPAAARASKATLYRRWNGKVALVIDALISQKGQPVVPDTGTLRGDLLETFCGVGGLTDHSAVATFASVLTAISRDAEFAAAFRERVVGPKAAAGRLVFERAQARGELREGVDLDLLAPALAGICLHRLFLMGLPPDQDTIRQVVDQIILPAALAPHVGVLDPARELRKPTCPTNSRSTTAPTRDDAVADQAEGPPEARPGPRAHLDRAADGRPRRDHRQHRPAVHRQGPRHHRHQPDLDRHRLLAGVRWPAAPRRPARRPLRPAPDLHDRPRGLRRGVAARWSRPERAAAAVRPRSPGLRCRARVARRPGADHHDVPGRARPQPGVRDLRRHVGRRCGRRPHPRRLAHRLRLQPLRPRHPRLADDLPHQRADRHRRPPCSRRASCPSPRPARATSTSRAPSPAPPACSRSSSASPTPATPTTAGPTRGPSPAWSPERCCSRSSSRSSRGSSTRCCRSGSSPTRHEPPASWRWRCCRPRCSRCSSSSACSSRT